MWVDVRRILSITDTCELEEAPDLCMPMYGISHGCFAPGECMGDIPFTKDDPDGRLIFLSSLCGPKAADPGWTLCEGVGDVFPDYCYCLCGGPP